MKLRCPCGNLFDPKVGKDGSIRIVCERCAYAIAKDRVAAPCWGAKSVKR